jgi:hypothetical protein
MASALPPPRGYNLGMLFLLTAFCASVLGLVSPVLRGFAGRGMGPTEMVIVSAVGGGLLAVLGGLLGFLHYSRLAGVFGGAMIGGILGMLCAPALFVPLDFLALELGLTLLGSAVVVGLAAAIRHQAKSRAADENPFAPGAAARKPAKPKPHPLDPDPEDDQR